MQLKVILNRVYRHASFVYGPDHFVTDDRGMEAIEIEVQARKGSPPECSGCGEHAMAYDHLQPRRFEFVPLWGLVVFLLYAMRRVDCPRCGVVVERVPWAEGKEHLTTAYVWFLARWAKRLSWKEIAEVFSTSWDTVFRCVAKAVEWGRAHIDLTGIEAIGADELHWRRGQDYLTLIYQIDVGCRRLLWIGRKRTAKTLLRFFKWFGVKRSQALRFVASDMWRAWRKVIARKAGEALHVLDRFHIMAHMNKAIDEVRRQEVRQLRARGKKPILTKTRWLLLKRPKNLTRPQRGRLRELVRHNLKAVRASLLREDFQHFWSYRSVRHASRFLTRWCRVVMRSRIEPMKKVARMLRRHFPLILNWVRAKGAISSGSVEGLNLKANLASRKAYGFRGYRTIEVALYHQLGNLPEPEFAHRFC